MRTKLFKSIAAVALVAIAASCAKEQTSVPLGGETEVSFSIASPVINTKAIADGNTVDKVVCNVFDSAGKLVEGTEDHKISKTIDMTNGTAKFSVRLVTGQTYSFIFWAYKDSESSPYTLSEDGKTVTVSYENAVSNDESRDAFYAYVAPVQIKGSLSQSVELKRPFAQLNFGVVKDDIKAAEAAEIEVSKSKVTLTGLGNTLNLVDGSVKAIVEGAEVSDGITAEFALATCPMSLESPETLTVDSDEYGYVAMNYVLVGKDSKSLTDATLWIADAAGTLIKEDGLAVSNVPLQGNYRTNVLGNLFTSEVITTVNVAPAFVEDIVKEFVSITAEKIEEANTLIEANKAADIIEVKFAAAPEDNSSQAILTTPVKEDGTLNVEVSSSVTGTLYVGDYKDAEYSDSQALEDADSANKATVNITIPDGVTIEKLVIKAGSKTVTINGVNASEYSDSNKIGTLEATTSMNTLVIAKGQIIDNLIFHKGGLEIHGTVNAITFDDNATTETVEVRDCEGLSEEVYNALKSYIKTGYVGVQNADKTWDITMPIKMNGVGYASLEEAVAAAGSEETTITLDADIKISSQVTIKDKKIILNTNERTIDPTGCRALVVDGTGELTVNGGGKFIASNSTGDNNAILNLYSGKLTIGDVYIEGANVCVAVAGGYAVINDAEMKAINGGCCVLCNDESGVVDIKGISFSCAGDDPDGPGACWAQDGGTINILDGTFNAAPLNNKTHELEVLNANYCLFDYAAFESRGYKRGYINVYGGSFKDFNPAADNQNGHSLVPDGYQSVEENGYWTVSKISE